MIVMDGGAPLSARTFDLGLAGISLTSEHKVNVGATGQIVFEMLVDGKPQIVHTRGKANHCIFSGGEFKIGFVFLPLDNDAAGAITKFMR
ncbi:MAG: PilZ protein [Pseudoduganella sp.]|jgi:hypothetical protein|nr:PilZ protein [Pseudoduganella sp.]